MRRTDRRTDRRKVQVLSCASQLKIATLFALRKAAKKSGNLDLVQKAVDGIKRLAEKTGLEGFKELYSVVKGQC